MAVPLECADLLPNKYCQRNIQRGRVVLLQVVALL